MNDIVPYEQRIGALTVTDVRAQVNLIQHVMREVMKKDEHYGVIPGTGTKPTLLKAGAEKLCLTFRLDPQYETTEKYDGAHLTVVSKCTLYHIPSSQRFGSGMGSCSTKESKYAYRQAKRKCPSCGAEAINKSKFPPRNAPKGTPAGWYCYAKQGGCGKEFAANDEAIVGQDVGRIANEDLADQYNTVLKMANKRSLIAAVLNATAASDIFTQDIEDTAKDVGGDVFDHYENPAASQSVPPADAGSPFAPASEAAGPIKTRTDTLKSLCATAGATLPDILAQADCTHADELSEEDYDSAVRMLNRRIAKKLAAHGEAMAEKMQP